MLNKKLKKQKVVVSMIALSLSLTCKCHRPPYGPYGACSRGTNTPSASSYLHRRHTKGSPVTV